MIDFKKLKEGDLVYWKAKDTPKTKKGKHSCVCGVFMKYFEGFQKILVMDCYILSNEAPYGDDGIAFLGKDSKFEIPTRGIKSKYWKIRNNNRDTTLYEREQSEDSRYWGED